MALPGSLISSLYGLPVHHYSCTSLQIREGDISEEEAVRIFVQFARVESAIKGQLL